MPPPRSSAKRSRPHPACAGQGSNVGAARCRIRFDNAHGTALRELLYPWHPWFGLQVTIHGAIEKSDGVVFRCTACGSDVERALEVPAWMFERAACSDHVQLTAAPFIDMTALSALADLLRQVLKDVTASSNAPLSSAFESSHDENRREVHVRIDANASVNRHEGRPKITRESPRRATAADRLVRRRSAKRLSDCADVARTAVGGADHADQPDGAVDPAARSGKQNRISNGGRP